MSATWSSNALEGNWCVSFSSSRDFPVSHLITRDLDYNTSSRLIMRDLVLLLKISSYNARSQLIVKRDLDLYCLYCQIWTSSSLVYRLQQRSYRAKIALIEDDRDSRSWPLGFASLRGPCMRRQRRIFPISSMGDVLLYYEPRTTGNEALKHLNSHILIFTSNEIISQLIMRDLDLILAEISTYKEEYFFCFQSSPTLYCQSSNQTKDTLLASVIEMKRN